MTDEERIIAEQNRLNLIDQIEHLKKTNEQILGKLDAYESIIKLMLKILMER